MLGSKVIGSVGEKKPARNIPFISIGYNNPLVLTIDPNFLGSSAETSLRMRLIVSIVSRHKICRF